MRKKGRQSSSIIGPPLVPLTSELYKHFAIPIVHVTSGLFLLLERKFISLCTDLDQISEDDKDLQSLYSDEIKELLKSECSLLDEQKELGESWIENKDIADALRTENFDSKTKCDAETCIVTADLVKTAPEILWVECTGDKHDKGKF